MLRARRHRPRARDRPRVRARDRSIRRGFVPRIRIRTPDARANAKSTRATRAGIPHTHTPPTRHLPFASERLATRDARVDVSRPIARVHHVGTRLPAPPPHIGPESTSLRPQPSYTTRRLPISPIHDPPRRARTRTHPPITTPRASSTRPPSRVLHRGKSKNPSAVARSIHHDARARVHRPPRLRRASSARAGG